MTKQTPDEGVQQLLRQIEVGPTDFDRFRGDVDQREGRLFGGLVLAQSVMAAGHTVASGTIHSLHAYFLRAGKPAEPIDYTVERIREGRNFFTRRVTAVQGGHTIFEASVSFTTPEPGISHQASMPPAPDPEGQKSWWESINMPPIPERMRRHRFNNPIDIRAAGGDPYLKGPEGLPRRMVWAKPTGPLPEDPLIHAAAMAYTSDSGMVATVAHAYGLWMPGGSTASLDHAIWFHHPPQFDDWLLYVTDSPAAHNARGLTWGHMFNRQGTLVASVAQEGLFRQMSTPPPAP
jgi:acyl-CoA thioesterase-2